MLYNLPMLARLPGLARFALERWVQRGVVHQLVLMVTLVVTVAVLGGLAAWALTGAFAGAPEAVWWAFLRLTDPGYLGDDEGVLLRVISTLVTVLGYVIFMGSMIAIMTQWLALTIRRLESGLTPIAMRDHVAILGWTNRTPEVVKKLLRAGGRLERFLASQEAGKLRVVILADQVDAARRLELREYLGGDWDEGQVFLRSGSSMRHEDLARLDLARAAVVVVPGTDFELGGAANNDARVIKTLLTLGTLLRQSSTAHPPRVVAEVVDPRKVELARETLGGGTEVLSSDHILSRLISQSLRHRGVARVLLQLFTHREGNAVYLRSFPELAGSSSRELQRLFPEAIVLGVHSTRDGTARVHLDPSTAIVLEPEDQLVLLAESYDECGVVDRSRETPPVRAPLPRNAERAASPVDRERRRLLILGWSYKLRSLLGELQESENSCFDVTILSRVGAEERAKGLGAVDLNGDRVRVTLVHGDYSSVDDLRGVDPARFDDVLIVSSSWLASSEEADARVTLGIVLLRSLLRDCERKPEVFVELLDPDDARDFDDDGLVIFVTPRIQSHLLAHVALRPELNAVFDGLICAGGAELEFRSATELGLEASAVTFAQVQAAAAAVDAVALGLHASRTGGAPQTCLNPDRDEAGTLRSEDRVILLALQQAA